MSERIAQPSSTGPHLHFQLKGIDRETAVKRVEQAQQLAQSSGVTLSEAFAMLSSAARIEAAEAERDAALARLADVERGITWDTTCITCAKWTETAHGNHERAELAEAQRDVALARLARIEKDVRQLRSYRRAVSRLFDRASLQGYVESDRYDEAIDALADPEGGT